jgi:hypothetical protein
MSAIDDIRKDVGLYVTSGQARSGFIELSDTIKDETINRRKDTLDLLSCIAGVEERFNAAIQALTERLNLLSKCYEGHLVDYHPAKMPLAKMPPAGPVRLGPVLNDEKPFQSMEPWDIVIKSPECGCRIFEQGCSVAKLCKLMKEDCNKDICPRKKEFKPALEWIDGDAKEEWRSKEEREELINKAEQEISEYVDEYISDNIDGFVLSSKIKMVLIDLIDEARR